jgi:hypothetical protein
MSPKTEVGSDKKEQINPEITAEVKARLEELMPIYGLKKYEIVNVALEYGLWNFKRAWGRYNAVRKARFKDDDD